MDVPARPQGGPQEAVQGREATGSGRWTLRPLPQSPRLQEGLRRVDRPRFGAFKLASRKILLRRAQHAVKQSFVASWLSWSLTGRKDA